MKRVHLEPFGGFDHYPDDAYWCSMTYRATVNGRGVAVMRWTRARGADGYWMFSAICSRLWVARMFSAWLGLEIGRYRQSVAWFSGRWKLEWDCAGKRYWSAIDD